MALKSINGQRLNGTKKSLKACVASFPASRLGTDSEWAAASGQERGGGSPPGMGSQPPGWEPVRVRAVS